MIEALIMLMIDMAALGTAVLMIKDAIRYNGLEDWIMALLSVIIVLISIIVTIDLVRLL